MIVTIKPSRAKGRVIAPPSKSMAHRLLICAGFAEGTSVIHNVDYSEDILATLDCLRALGAGITCKDGSVAVSGIDVRKVSFPSVLPCRECGSTLRFMIPACLMSGQKNTLTGSGILFKRPLGVYEEICREQGLLFEKEGSRLTVKGRLRAGNYVVPGNISSQFISGLLFVLPLLEEDSRIELLPPVESRSYIRMTMQALEQFGVTTLWEEPETETVVVRDKPKTETVIVRDKPETGAAAAREEPETGTATVQRKLRAEKSGRTDPAPCVIRIPGRQKYRPRDLSVEGDYSNAAFFEALNLLGGNVRVYGLSEDSLQGDRIYRRYIKELAEGCPEVDLSDCPDLGPVLMAMAAALNGAVFTGTRRLRIKESDRGAAMQQELAKMNARVECSENEIRVSPGVSRPHKILDGHNDHRIVMALTVLLTETGGSISGAEAVSKSLPDYFDRLKKLGIEYTVT